MNIFIIGHILGAFIGAGAAYTSDITFMRSIRDGVIDQTEFRRLIRLSRFVWVGLALLIFSGVGLFLAKPDFYLHSVKFMSKMSIVLLLTINGIIFHVYHLPFIKRRIGATLFIGVQGKQGSWIILSGVLSVVSWTAALVLGTLDSVPFSYPTMIAFYSGVLGIGALFATVTIRKLLEKTDVSFIRKCAVGLGFVTLGLIAL